jgi:hypothetical protein
MYLLHFTNTNSIDIYKSFTYYLIDVGIQQHSRTIFIVIGIK